MSSYCSRPRASQVALVVESPPANAGDARDTGLIPWLGWEDTSVYEWQPTPVLLPGKFHEQRGLAGDSLWGRKESDTTDHSSSSSSRLNS